MRRRALTAVTAVTAALIGCLASCGSGGNGGGGTDGGDIRAVDGPVDTGTLNDICDGHSALTAAPPYAGPGPHPVMVFSQQQGNDPNGPTLAFRLLNDVGQPEREAFSSPIARTQLVACAERAEHVPTEVVCRFDLGSPDPVPFFRTSYRITVREAHTGKVVATKPVDPAAAGCPTSVRVAWMGAEVFSAPTDRQFVSALTAFTSWEGTGTPPRAGEPADLPAPTATPVVAGSVRMTTAAGVDATSQVVRDHLAFWATFSAIQEGDRVQLSTLQDQVDPGFLSTLLTILDPSRTGPGRATRGPVHLMVTGVSQENGTVAVDSCLDETERETLQQSEPTGEIGTSGPIRVNLRQNAGGYLATGFADAPPAACPPPAGRIG